MDASTMASSAKAYFSSSFPDSFTERRGKLSRNSKLLPFYPTGRKVQPLRGPVGSSASKHGPVKVLCSQRREIPIVDARCMDETYNVLAERLVPTAAVAASNSKHIVGLAGPPGAGKSTLASEVVQRINKLWPQKVGQLDSQVEPMDVATVLPMDGFHLYRSQLDAMENPEEAHARRGAPWTFDPMLLLQCLRNLRAQGSVYAPSFDHGVGDPVEDDILVGIQHKVIIVEGNYLFLEEGVWKEVSSVFDEKWTESSAGPSAGLVKKVENVKLLTYLVNGYLELLDSDGLILTVVGSAYNGRFIDVDIDKAMQRVLKRHISTGKPPDVAKWRIEYNDQPNAELILESKKNADLIIRSIDL